MELCIAFLQMCGRLQVHVHRGVLWAEGLSEWADNVMVQAFASMRKAGLGLEVFWEVHHSVAGMLVDPERVRRILACKTRWTDCTKDLTHVLRSAKNRTAHVRLRRGACGRRPAV